MSVWRLSLLLLAVLCGGHYDVKKHQHKEVCTKPRVTIRATINHHFLSSNFHSLINYFMEEVSIYRS